MRTIVKVRKSLRNDHRCKRRSKMDIDYVGIGSMMMAIRMVLKISIMMMMMVKMVLKIPTLILRRRLDFSQVGHQVPSIITTTSSSYLLHSTLMSFGFFFIVTFAPIICFLVWQI